MEMENEGIRHGTNFMTRFARNHNSQLSIFNFHYCRVTKKALTPVSLRGERLPTVPPCLQSLEGLPLGVLNANDTAQHTAVFRCAARESVLFSPHCVCLQPWRTLSAKCFSENRISVIAYNLINTNLL